MVAATSAGYDHLDLDAIAAAGAWATHCPGYCDEEVAEHAIALALDLLRGVTLLDRSVHDGAWNHPLAADPVVTTPAPAGMRLVSLGELLGAADVVTLHAPLGDQTRGMIGAAQLAAMRGDAFLINCARAELVDNEALGEALASGRLAGCALDVLPREPPAPDDPELDWPRTVITPHAAWFSPRSATLPYTRAGEAVAAVLAGREPRNALVRPHTNTTGGNRS